MIDVNWDNFAAKFSSDKQTAFERLCYLLFCKEHSKDTGIFRFKNHAGIETNPVEKDGQIVGWQAKFYGTRLSEHKDDFIESIDTTKTRHPEVTKIIFYTNQEFGQDKKKTDPQYKAEIESHAKTKGVEIEWRTRSYFESPFVCEQNSNIAEHFFSQKTGILGSIAELQKYTESVLQPIRPEIVFGEHKIKLDRSALIGSIKDTVDTYPLIVLSGGAGVGKTAVIKDLYERLKENTPFFVFKAMQFEGLANINALFKGYGEITASEFIKEHADIPRKYLVIDSAERLSEIEDQSIFRTFLYDLVQAGWSVIFTVRHSYLDDLRYQLREFYGTDFTSLDIPILSIEELDKISNDYSFKLPTSERLVTLLRTPLYLSVYLQNYGETKGDISYPAFREIIWKKYIQNSSYQSSNLHRRREECFLKIAKQRANEGGFFVKTTETDQEALKKLEDDEIIKFDSNVRGYFITHDVYEEWALDTTIESAFTGVSDYQTFYNDIGNSLPIRRAFRSWLSDKLFANDENAARLIGFTIQDPKVENHWKDEVVVSALLSDYSKTFFEIFENELLKEPERVVSVGGSEVVRTISVDYKVEQRLLHRIAFLLRIACKTIDESFLARLGLRRANAIPLKTIFTIPKGTGWNSTIAFINKHKEKLQLRYMSVILPVLDDWNKSHKEGSTTKDAAQIALFYYNSLTSQKDFYWGSRDDTKDQLIRTILNGSSEIKEELKAIVQNIIDEKDTTHRGRYYELVKKILGSILDSSEVAKHLPEEVIKLANLFWFYTPLDEGRYPFSDYRNDIEQYFDLTEGHLEYYPASALQTPVATLLQTDPQKAVDFILSFTNRSIEYFAKSEFAQYEAEEIEVVIDDSGTTVKQYACHRIWNLYRGTQVAPPLLESIHMALEHWLLMAAKNWDPKVVEQWCLYLIKNSRSGSTTAIVVSAVLAEPSKLFNVAKILFRTKDLFSFDMARMQLDMTHASFTYSLAHDPLGVFRDERMQTCEDKHRNHSLENQALNYQLFATEEEGEEVAKARQEEIWKIFDGYYAALPDKAKESERDKTWRLCLARMDRRKMKISTEKQGDQTLIKFNPEIDPELKKYSEDALEKNAEAGKYLPLQLWARNRFERKEDAKKYPQYEDNYSLALTETKAVIEQLKNDDSEDGQFTLFYRSVPAYVCSVLLRDFFEKLKPEEAQFCKEVLLEYSSMPLGGGYKYQTGDGLDASVSALPLLLKKFPDDSARIKEILLLVLFDMYPIGMNSRVYEYAVDAILGYLWKESAEDANSLLYGYLILKPRFDSIREERRKKGDYNFSKTEVIERFRKECSEDIAKMISNSISYKDIADVAKIEIETLVTAFLLVPLKTIDESHKQFLRDITPPLIDSFKNNEREERLDYGLAQKFQNKFAYFVLSSEKEEIELYVKPFIDLVTDFRGSKNATDILEEFVLAEDRLNQYEEFWIVWNIFYPKLVELCSDEHKLRYSESVVYKYLFALSWKKEAKEWHTLKDREKVFFKKVSEEMGGNSPVLYAIAKLLNDIGSTFATDGLSWISTIIEKTPDLVKRELEVNTVYYLENFVRSYILRHRQKIKADPQLKKKVLIILNFLLEKASVTAYLLREDIL